MERTESAPSTTPNAPQRSRLPRPANEPPPRTPKARKRLLNARSTRAYGRQRARYTSVPESPNAVTAATLMMGPRQKPIWPPTEKIDMLMALSSPPARYAKRAPSGCSMALPIPETIAAKTTSQYDCSTPTSAMPKPASATPTDMSHGRAFLSPMSPNRGWMTADATFDAKTSAVISVYENPD